MDSSLRRKILKAWVSVSGEERLNFVFEKVRDLPYGDEASPKDAYEKQCGTNSAKNELLRELFREMGVKTKSYVAIHNFNDMRVAFPRELSGFLDSSTVTDAHVFFRILADGKWITVDAAWPKSLKKFGFIVNEKWDGKSSMEVCVMPRKIYETRKQDALVKSQLAKLPAGAQRCREEFLARFSSWMDSIQKR